MTLTSLVLLQETGCNGPEKRPYAATDSVATFRSAVWCVDEDGKWYQIEAVWQFEKEMREEDIKYQFREGVVVTPGNWARIQKKLVELKHLKERSTP